MYTHTRFVLLYRCHKAVMLPHMGTKLTKSSITGTELRSYLLRCTAKFLRLWNHLSHTEHWTAPRCSHTAFSLYYACASSCHTHARTHAHTRTHVYVHRHDLIANCGMFFPYSARVIAVRRVQGPGGIAQQTSYAIEQPGCPTRQVTRTIIVRPASGRPNNPNLPPSYDQAVTGADRSVKVNDGEDLPLPNAPPQEPPPPEVPSAPAPEPNRPLPHMPPPRSSALLLPPAYTPSTTATPAPPTHYEDNGIDATESQRLLA